MPFSPNKIWLLRILNALLITLIAWFAATLTWRVLTPTPDLPPATTNNLTTAAVANTTPQIDVMLISRLFGGGQSDGATSASSLPYKLRGVIGAGKGVDAAAIFAGGGAKDVVVRVGDELQAGVKLVEVRADFALVDNHGRQERIELDAKPALKLDTPSASATSNDLIKPVNNMQVNVSPQTGGAQSLAINMPRAKLIAAMQSGNVAEWASGLRTDPRKGIRVEPGSAPGLVQTLQLQPGDVMQRINGRVLSQPGDITLVYNEFSQKNKIQLELLRHDRALTLDYTLQP